MLYTIAFPCPTDKSVVSIYGNPFSVGFTHVDYLCPLTGTLFVGGVLYSDAAAEPGQPYNIYRWGYIIGSISLDSSVCWLWENDKMVLGRFPNDYAVQHTQAGMFYDYVCLLRKINNGGG